MTAQISRRRFLKRGCLTTAAVGVTLCGGTALANTYQPKINMPSSSFGEQGADNRVLIAYGTKAGSTAEIAMHMGEIAAKNRLAVDVLPVEKVTDLSPYRTVILGSAIRTGNLLPEVMTFIEKNQAALQQKAFSVFIVCMTLQEDTEENRKKVSAYLDPVRALVKPASEGIFAGVMDPSKLKILERLIILAMGAPSGDFRKWDQVSAWAGSVN